MASPERGRTYVYGVLRAGGAPPIASKGIEGRPVGLLESGRLAALVSAAPPGDVRGSPGNLKAHTHVLQEVVAAGRCVLPMRFGVAMPGEEAVREELLQLNEWRLLEQLDDFDQLVELDLKVLCPAEMLLRKSMERRPDLRRRRDMLESRAPEATYYERIALGELVAAAVEAQREELTRTVLNLIEPLTVDVEVGEPFHEHMVASLSLLVERARLHSVDAAVQAVERQLEPACSVSYVGPLPPYSFTGLDVEARAWA